MAIISKPGKLGKGKGKGKPSKLKSASKAHTVTTAALVTARKNGKPAPGWTVTYTEGANGAIRATITSPAGTTYSTVGMCYAWGWCGGSPKALAAMLPTWGVPCRTSTLIRRVSAGSSAKNGTQAGASTGIGKITAPGKADLKAIEALIAKYDA